MMFLYIIIAAVVFGSILFYLISSVKKLGTFLKIYDESSQPVYNDDYDYSKPKNLNPEKPKHSRKTMMFSLLKYLGILVLLVLITAINAYVIIVMIFAWGFTLYFTSHYIKLWKYHGYSVLLLLFLSIAVIAGAAVLTQMQFYKDGMGAAWSFIMNGIRGT